MSRKTGVTVAFFVIFLGLIALLAWALGLNVLAAILAVAIVFLALISTSGRNLGWPYGR